MQGMSMAPTVVNLTESSTSLQTEDRSKDGNVAQKQYILTYRSTYPGTLLRGNLAQLVSQRSKSTQIVSNYKVMDSSEC